MKVKIHSLPQLYDAIDPNEKIIVDLLRRLIDDVSQSYCKEKISYNVPYFYKNKGMFIIWPASIPRGGIKSGVLFGFWQGPLIEDKNEYLIKGTNKKVFYNIFQNAEEIDIDLLSELILLAKEVDKQWIL